MRTRVARHARDYSTNSCITNTTTVWRYRLTSATPSQGSTCTGGYGESLRTTVNFSRNTCANNADTRDDGETFVVDFSSESDISSSQFKYYREVLRVANSPGSNDYDGCYAIWWHP